MLSNRAVRDPVISAILSFFAEAAATLAVEFLCHLSAHSRQNNQGSLPPNTGDTPLRASYSLGYVSLPAFAAISLGTVFAAPFGVRLAHVLRPQVVRRVFALFLVATAIRMAWGLLD